VTQAPDDRRIRIEKLGGFAGFGASAHLRSEGEVALEKLPEPDRAKVAKLLDRDAGDHPNSLSQFVYRLSWKEGGKTKSVDVAEDDLPHSVVAAVKDKLL
jgi:hypothetical protein